MELAEAYYVACVQSIRQGKDHAQLMSSVESWKWIATSALLSRLSRPVRRVAVLRTVPLPSGGFAVELEDDGRGVDFEALAPAALRKGLPSKTRS